MTQFCCVTFEQASNQSLPTVTSLHITGAAGPQTAVLDIRLKRNNEDRCISPLICDMESVNLL